MHALRRAAVLTAGALIVSCTTVLGAGPAAAEPLNPCVNPDNSPPVVEDVTFSPSSVDVSSGPQQVTLSMQISESGAPGPQPSGVAKAIAYIRAPDGPFNGRVELEPSGGDTWSADFTVPRYAPTGAWRVGYMVLYDAAGNSPGEDFAAVTHQPPFDEALTVSSSSSPDTEGPIATALTIGDRRVDTTRRSADVRVEVSAGDVGSGIDSVVVRADHRGDEADATLVDQGDGTYAGSLRIRRWVGTGDWKITWIGVRDALGNQTNYRRDRLRALGDNVFHVVSRTDEAEPVLRSLDVDPGAVDVRRRGHRIVLTARIDDPRSGVREASGFISSHVMPLERIRGTAKHGTWRGHLRLTPCTRPVRDHSWVVVEAYDGAGNEMHDPARKMRVRHRDLRPPQFSFTTHSVAQSGPVTIAFDEPVNGISDRSATVQQWSQGRYAPPLAGSWACFEKDGDVTSCRTGRVRSAAWTPEDPLAATHAHVVLNPVGTLELTDLHGNPFHRDEADVRVK
ncbi:hypothetical protein ACT8ZV_20840 [Nocardioides sp. MAHUQ-72]|uniref:hypothetical protein n=1 Tax=unclassified Nocardioides TaxID=2615069 RepID=UPI003618A395